MPIAIETIQAASNLVTKSVKRTLNEAKAANITTAFLCHSHKDESLVKGIINLLEQSGWNVYVDWEDTLMPETPNQETAIRIKKKIKELKYFLFLATSNSTKSRWCPWEIGYADGVKNPNQIIIIPTKEGSGTHHGNEYLQLYPRLDEASGGGLAVWQPGQTSNGIWAKSL